MGILAAILGVLFILAGGMKLMQGKEGLASNPQMAWVEDFTGQQVQLIGAAELLGGLGLIFPFWLDIAAFLTPVAAICLALLMGGAAYTHVRRGETAPPQIAGSVVLGILSIVVFFGMI